MNNPSLRAVCFGEVLWDLLPTGARAGGAPMNVAYHLSKLGWNSTVISRIGKDHWGEDLLKHMNHHGIDVSYIQVDPAQPTGLVNATIGANHEVSYDIVQPSAWDFISDDQLLNDLATNSNAFIFGSLSMRNAVSEYTLLSLLDSAPYRVMDINLRPPFIFPDRIAALLPTLKILKLNEHELPLLSSWFGGPTQPREQLRHLQDRFRIPLIVVTMGGNGAMVIDDGNIASHPGFPVEVADTIGSGDAFLAAFLTEIFKGSTAAAALESANALGSFVAGKQGACPEYEKFAFEVRVR